MEREVPYPKSGRRRRRQRLIAIGIAVAATGSTGPGTSATRAAMPQTTPCQMSLSADAYITARDTDLTVPAPGVLANDAETCAALLIEFTQPTNGALTDTGAGGFMYSPNAGFIGVDTFTYTVSSEFAAASTTVRLDVGTTCVVSVSPDSYSTFMGENLSVPTPGVLGNDAELCILIGMDFGQPANGTVTEGDLSGEFTYSPNAGFSGSDSFTYTVRAGDGAGEATTTVTIDVICLREFADDHYSVQSGQELAVAAPGVGANDALCPGENVFQLGGGPTHGQVELGPDGRFTYRPDAGFVGTDSFAYDVNDTLIGDEFAPTVTIDVTAVPPGATTPTVTTPTLPPATTPPSAPPVSPNPVLPATR